MKRATWMTAVAMLAVAACAKGDKSAQQPADSHVGLLRYLELER